MISYPVIPWLWRLLGNPPHASESKLSFIWVCALDGVQNVYSSQPQPPCGLPLPTDVRAGVWVELWLLKLSQISGVLSWQNWRLKSSGYPWKRCSCGSILLPANMPQLWHKGTFSKGERGVMLLLVSPCSLCWEGHSVCYNGGFYEANSCPVGPALPPLPPTLDHMRHHIANKKQPKTSLRIKIEPKYSLRFKNLDLRCLL